ncbi:cytochrome P450 monooxygenase [Aspergillus nomiae NRRL 13137]|uniref:Cytochrome P450 monooxygenase n=1 Tax=Aspergillus nomiae NRRL (strain ATCC 15546 / NRRL 13137 / CBS 260.88 / M93) TaxID=1509407 RepID=A0A0L1JD93_ASPN3|nr:cytochrome P450 monooxygenase [Aspergillus nomiae NRRL 13137]KNG89754.1 cytochrome P450 monooxygenase [Aspergillus nomiae NRRL 13137]
MVVCVIAILILGLFAFVRALCNYTRLSTVPGPLFTGLCDLWRTYARNTGNYGCSVAGLHKKYGKVVRLGPHSISVSDPTAIFPVYNGRPSERSTFEHDNRTTFAQGSSARTTDVESTLLSKATRRRCLESAMRYEGIVNQAANNLMTSLRQQPVVHLTTFLQGFTADFIHRLVLEESVTQDMPSNAQQACCHWYNRPTKWFTFPTIEYALLRSPVARLKRRRGISFVQKTQGGINSSRSFRATDDRAISSSLDLPQGCDGAYDCIAMAFISTFSSLLKHETVMARLRSEIDTAFNKGLLSDPPRWQELGKLRYLDAVIKESMRQLPSLSYNREVVTPPEGAIVAGYYIPPGTMMELHSEALRGDPSTYGEDVHNYRPARWLNVDPRQRWAMSQNLVPFSTSINNSPKVRVAWMELKKIVVLLLLKFNLELIRPGEGPILSDMSGQGLPPLMAYCSPRNH